MSRYFFSVLLGLLMPSFLHAQEKFPPVDQFREPIIYDARQPLPNDGIVNTAAVAQTIAEITLQSIGGSELLSKIGKLTAEPIESYGWAVYGGDTCKNISNNTTALGPKNCAVIEIDKSDGRVSAIFIEGLASIKKSEISSADPYSYSVMIFAWIFQSTRQLPIRVVRSDWQRLFYRNLEDLG